MVAIAFGILIGVGGTLLIPETNPVRSAEPHPFADAETNAVASPDRVVGVTDHPTLAEILPGLANDILAFGTDPKNQAWVLRWTLTDSEPEAAGITTRIGATDRSGHHLASLEAQRLGGGYNLVAGNDVSVETIAVDVGSFHWSATTPADIAWTQRTADGWVLRSAGLDGESTDTPQMDIAHDDIDGDGSTIAWYHDDAVVFQDNAGTLTGVDRNGAVVATLGSAAGFVGGTENIGVVWIGGVATLIDSSLNVVAPLLAITDECFAPLIPPQSTAELLTISIVCGVKTGAVLDVYTVDLSSGTHSPVTTRILSQPLPSPTSPNWVGGDRFIAWMHRSPDARPLTDMAVVDLETGDINHLTWPGRLLWGTGFASRPG